MKIKSIRIENFRRHERDNRALVALLGQSYPLFPADTVVGANYAIWATNLGATVRADFGDHYDVLANAVRARYANEGGLEKNELFIAEWLSAGRHAGHGSATLWCLCDAILDFARTT